MRRRLLDGRCSSDTAIGGGRRETGSSATERGAAMSDVGLRAVDDDAAVEALDGDEVLERVGDVLSRDLRFVSRSDPLFDLLHALRHVCSADHRPRAVPPPNAAP